MEKTDLLLNLGSIILAGVGIVWSISKFTKTMFNLSVICKAQKDPQNHHWQEGGIVLNTQTQQLENGKSCIDIPFK